MGRLHTIPLRRALPALALLAAVVSPPSGTWAAAPVRPGLAGSTAARPLLQDASGNIQFNCQLNSAGGVTITVTFNRPGPPPSGTVTLTRLDGSTEVVPFTSTNNLSFSGTYRTIDVQATWPDGATGYASGDCSGAYPTPTPIPPTATPTATTTPSPTNTPGPTNTPRPTTTPQPTITPGGPTVTPSPTRAPTLTTTPAPSVTPGGPTVTPPPPSATPGGPPPPPPPPPPPTSTPDTSIDISIDCDYFSDTDRQFTVTLAQRAAGAPNGTAILALVAGGSETQTFATTTAVYRGAYQSIRVNVTWPDGASATGGTTCGLQLPTPTPPPATATTAATATPSRPPPQAPPAPPATGTPAPPPAPPEQATATPEAPAPPPPATPETPPLEEATPTAAVSPPPATETPPTAVPPPTAPPAPPPTAVPPAPTQAPPRPPAVAGGPAAGAGVARAQPPSAVLPDTAASDVAVRGGLGAALVVLVLGAALRRQRRDRR